MKGFFSFLSLSIILISQISAQTYIRVNQLGYLPGSIKTAIVLSNEEKPQTFEIINSKSNRIEKKFSSIEKTETYGKFEQVYRLDFSEFSIEGEYYLRIGKSISPKFAVNKEVYEGSADFLLNYMRQQRCGFNPFLRDSCHTEDGFIIYHPELDSTYIEVSGGWHDASDYLQYLTTSANVIFQMLFAYKQNPDAFGDNYHANGLLGSNGIPDVLDEAKWGLAGKNESIGRYDVQSNRR